MICFFNLFSQDQLFKKDNSKFEVKILEITPNEIKYKLSSYLDGPTITILKSEVALIIYANGTHETFNTDLKPVVIINDSNSPSNNYYQRKRAELYDSLTQHKNLVSFNTIELMNGSLAFSYFREIPNYFISLYVPISVGFAEPIFNQLFGGSYYSDYSNPDSYISDYKFKRKTFEIGFGANFHTSGKRAISHYIGPYIGMMQFNGTYTENFRFYDSTGNMPTIYTINRGFVLNRYQFMVNNGFLFRINERFNMNLMLGLGFRRDEYISGNNFQNRYYITSNPIAFKLGLSVGYRF